MCWNWKIYTKRLTCLTPTNICTHRTSALLCNCPTNIEVSFIQRLNYTQLASEQTSILYRVVSFIRSVLYKKFHCTCAHLNHFMHVHVHVLMYLYVISGEYEPPEQVARNTAENSVWSWKLFYIPMCCYPVYYIWYFMCSRLRWLSVKVLIWKFLRTCVPSNAIPYHVDAPFLVAYMIIKAQTLDRETQHEHTCIYICVHVHLHVICWYI